MNKKDEVERIFDRAKHEVERCKHEALALLSSEPIIQAQEQTLPTWLTEEEVISYLRCSASVLRQWRNRPLDQHPIPHGMAGDMLRYKRTDIDRWLLEEAELKRLAKTPADEQSKRRGLSAVASPPPRGA